MVVATAAPVLALAAALALYGLRGSISYFYTPAQAAAAHVGAGQAIQLGGLVRTGSVVKTADGAVAFVVTDEGQGVVALGAFDRRGVFIATQILAKHDERYMPRELTKALKAQGEWRGDGAAGAYGEAR